MNLDIQRVHRRQGFSVVTKLKNTQNGKINTIEDECTQKRG